MAVILDSDMLSILQRRSEPACGHLEQRLGQLSDTDVFTTIVSFQEQMRGWLAAVHKSRTDKRLLLAYSELQVHASRFLSPQYSPVRCGSPNRIQKASASKDPHRHNGPANCFD
jgi:hypothetical protein